MKTLYLKKDQASSLCLEEFPNAGPRPSIVGMKKLYWGENALCIQSGTYVYKVNRETYNLACRILGEDPLPPLYYRIYDRQTHRYLCSAYNSLGYQELKEGYLAYIDPDTSVEDMEIIKKMSPIAFFHHLDCQEFTVESQEEKFEPHEEN